MTTTNDAAPWVYPPPTLAEQRGKAYADLLDAHAALLNAATDYADLCFRTGYDSGAKMRAIPQADGASD